MALLYFFISLFYSILAKFDIFIQNKHNIFFIREGNIYTNSVHMYYIFWDKKDFDYEIGVDTTGSGLFWFELFQDQDYKKLF